MKVIIENKRKFYRTKGRATLGSYEKKIDFFIPYAEKEARLRVEALGKAWEKRAGVDGRTYNHCFQTQFFHEIMKRITIEAGLRTF